MTTKKIIAEKKYSEVNMYFEKCLELATNYSNAYSSLKENDWDGAISNLRNYMKEIRKEKFEFLIVDLLKISLLDRDKIYFHIITEISKDTLNNYLINDLYRILKTSEKY